MAPRHDFYSVCLEIGMYKAMRLEHVELAPFCVAKPVYSDFAPFKLKSNIKF